MNYSLLSYAIYFLVMICVIIRAGHALHRGGLYFLVEIFKDRSLAIAINNLLLVGYYLLNLAYVLLLFKQKQAANSLVEVFGLVGNKTGGIILILAAVHYFNLIAFTIWKSYIAKRDNLFKNNFTNHNSTL